MKLLSPILSNFVKRSVLVALLVQKRFNGSKVKWMIEPISDNNETFELLEHLNSLNIFKL